MRDTAGAGGSEDTETTGGVGNGGASSGGASSGGTNSGGSSSGGAAGEANGGGAGEGGETDAGSGGTPGHGGTKGTGGSPVVPPPTPVLRCPIPHDAGGAGNAGGASSGGSAGEANDDEPLAGAGGWTTDLGFNVAPSAINAQGEVIATTRAGNGALCRSFFLGDDGLREIVVPGEPDCTEAVDLNDAGTVLGSVRDPSTPFIWNDGVTTTIAGPTGTPIAINDSGQILFDDALWEAGLAHELVAEDGTALEGLALNDAGQVLARVQEPARGFIWQAGVAFEIPVNSPAAMNELGHVVGHRDSDFGIWNGATFVPVPLPQGFELDAVTAMNSAGDFVGNHWTIGGYIEGPFVHQAGAFEFPYPAGQAHDINEHGDVAGEAWGTGLNRVGRFGGYPFVTWRAGRIWSARRSIVCEP